MTIPRQRSDNGVQVGCWSLRYVVVRSIKSAKVLEASRSGGRNDEALSSRLLIDDVNDASGPGSVSEPTSNDGKWMLSDTLALGDAIQRGRNKAAFLQVELLR